MRFRRRDHESFIGGYDPEHEMPDADRDPRDRWQSDAYRYGARDTRFAYRWNPDRFEDRYGDYRGDFSSRIQPPDRYEAYGRPEHGSSRGGHDYSRDLRPDYS